MYMIYDIADDHGCIDKSILSPGQADGPSAKVSDRWKVSCIAGRAGAYLLFELHPHFLHPFG